MSVQIIVLLLVHGVITVSLAKSHSVDPDGLYARPPNYRIEFESFKVHKNVAPEFVEWHYARLGLTERTNDIVVLNMNFTLKKDLPMDAWMEVAAHEMKANNDFSMIPVKMFAGRFCDVMKDKYLYADILLHSSLPAVCPMKKGEYFYHDYAVNEKKLPYELPGDRWRMDLEIKKRARAEVIIKYSLLVNLNRNI